MCFIACVPEMKGKSLEASGKILARGAGEEGAADRVAGEDDW